MQSRIYLTAIFALSVPLISFAQASFPAQSLWLSNTKPAVGDKVRIYAVVYNGSEAETSGSLTFLIDGKVQEERNLSLKSGESLVSSSVWTAAEGEHTFSARFGKDGVEAATSASIIAKVDAPPSQTEQAIAQAKDIGTSVASTSLPIISTVANKVFATTESIRTAGLEYLEDKVSARTSNPAVLGTTTVNQVEGFQNSNADQAESHGIVSKVLNAAAVGTLTVFRSLWLFYPILVLLLLFVFRSLYRWATGPRF